MVYDDHTLDDLHTKVLRAVAKLVPHSWQFDSIAVRGISGIVVGAGVALLMNKPLVIVRKPNESTHSYDHVENIRNVGQRYLFLDDFVASGQTRRIVEEDISREAPNATMVGQYLYQYDTLDIREVDYKD